MRIIKATDSIPVDHPVFMIFGQPGIGKSSLGYSCKDVLALDFDKGAHRAANRRDTLVIDTWKDIEDLMASPRNWRRTPRCPSIPSAAASTSSRRISRGRIRRSSPAAFPACRDGARSRTTSASGSRRCVASARTSS
jgi:hypothetical protein